MKTRFFKLSSVAVVATLVAVLAGCSDTPSPLASSEAPVNILQRHRLGKVAEGEVETIEDSIGVTTEQGGLLNVGDEEIGNSSLGVPDMAVNDETTVHLIKMKVNRIGEVSAELRPHGRQFSRQVWFSLSYKGSDLTGVNEDNLAIFYYNETTGVWELVDGSVVNKDKKRVSAPLWHFSKYAIGGGE